MRAYCIFRGGCKFETLREEWLPPAGVYRYTRMLRFSECPYCHTTRATITSPERQEARFSVVNEFCGPEPEPERI